MVADHLSHLFVDHIVETTDSIPIDDSFLDDGLLSVDVAGICEQIQAVLISEQSWYADFTNYLVSGVIPTGLPAYRKKKFLHDVKQYYWVEPYLFKQGSDFMYRRYIPEEEVGSVIRHCHSLPIEGAKAFKTTAKILQSRLYWPTMFKYVQ